MFLGGLILIDFYWRAKSFKYAQVFGHPLTNMFAKLLIFHGGLFDQCFLNCCFVPSIEHEYLCQNIILRVYLLITDKILRLVN